MIHPRRTGVVFLMVLLSVMTYIDRIIITIAGPGIMKEFSVSETQMGTIYSAYLFSYAIMMIPGGCFTDVAGPRVSLAVMAFGTGLFTALTALGGSPRLGTYIGVVASFLVIRLATGICASPMYPAAGRMSANWNAPHARARVWGWIASGAGFGGACTPLLFSWMRAHYGWRGSFLLAGVGSAALAGVWYWYVRDYPPVENRPHTLQSRVPTPWKDLFTNRDLMLVTAGYVTANYFEYIFFFWLYYYFGQIRKMGMDQSAIYTTLMWIAWILFTPTGGWASDKLGTRFGLRNGRRMVVVGCMTISAILVMIGSNVTGTAPTVILLCLSLGFASATDAPFWAAAIDASGKHSGTGGAIFNTGGNIGGMLAPTVTPLLAHWFGWSSGLYFGGAFALLGVLVWFFLEPQTALRGEAEVAS
ncbi:MAG TPA: MFS transporter [Bryobacteraceae bacterium]|nr:MFS transporter [Bryobacteraceae bacterium]